MAINVNNAFVGTPPIDGGVYSNAPVGTPMPKTATEALDAAFKDHGAVGPDGFTVTPTRTSGTEKMFGGGDFVDFQTEYTEDASLVLLEDDNEAVINSIFGEGNHTSTPATPVNGVQRTIFHSDKPLPIKSHVLKAAYGEKNKTYAIPLGRITSVEVSANTHSAATKMTVNIKCFKFTDPDGRSYYVKEMRDDGRPVTDA